MATETKHVDPLALDVEAFARAASLPPATVRQGMDPNRTRRAGLPYLPHITLGRKRLIRLETGRRWLAALELRPIDEELPPLERPRARKRPAA